MAVNFFTAKPQQTTALPVQRVELGQQCRDAGLVQENGMPSPSHVPTGGADTLGS